MKHYIRLSFFLVCLTASNSCKKPLKNIDDYYPRVTTLSAVLLSNGHVLVTGKIESSGASEIEQMGLNCSTNPNPGIWDKQIMYPTINGSVFTGEYANLSNDSAYYFTAWASNSFGYKTGQVLKIDSVYAVPVVPPCNAVTQSIKIASGNPTENTYAVDSCYNHGAGYWELAAHASSTTLYFEFGSAPSTGIYKTSYSNSTPGEVRVYFYSGVVSETLVPGSDVYVNEISNGKFEITICSGAWTFNGGSIPIYLQARFISPS